MRVVTVLVVRPYDSIYSDKHASMGEEIQISTPNLSEGGLLCSSINTSTLTSTDCKTLNGERRLINRIFSYLLQEE